MLLATIAINAKYQLHLSYLYLSIFTFNFLLFDLEYLGHGVRVQLLRPFAACVHAGAGLTTARLRFHVLVQLSLRIGIRVAVSEHRHRPGPSGVHANRMVGPLVRETPVGYFVRIAPSVARPHAHVVPTFAPFAVRLRHPIRKDALVATQHRPAAVLVRKLVDGGRSPRATHHHGQGHTQRQTVNHDARRFLRR